MPETCKLETRVLFLPLKNLDPGVAFAFPLHGLNIYYHKIDYTIVRVWTDTHPYQNHEIYVTFTINQPPMLTHQASLQLNPHLE